MILGGNSDDGDAMLAALEPEVLLTGVPEDAIDAILDFIIYNFYTPASEVRGDGLFLSIFSPFHTYSPSSIGHF